MRLYSPSMNLRGKGLVIAMAAGQVGGLLPHVAVPATMPAFLIPEWGLSYAEAGLMASAYAIGYMLASAVVFFIIGVIRFRYE